MTIPSIARIRVAVLLVALLPGAGVSAEPDAEGIALFGKRIRPRFVQHCCSCHSADAEKIKGELRLDTRDAVRKGGASGAALVPGEPSKSLLIKAVRYEVE